MIYPDFESFSALANKHKRVIVYREIAGDMITPIILLYNFSDTPNLFLLESANLDKSVSRYSFFGIQPERVITYKDGSVTVESRESGIERRSENPVEFMMNELKNENSSKEAGLGDFCGGYVGFMGYDLVNYMGTLRSPVREDRDNITMAFFQVDEFYVFDNHMKKLYAAVSVRINGDHDCNYEFAKERTLTMGREILSIHKKFGIQAGEMKRMQDFDSQAYIDTVESLKQEIINGECIQTVLSNRYEIECELDPINLYRMIRNINPSPYMFYLKYGGEVLCGTSPEVHLKISDRKAVLKPIAGTYRIEPGRLEEQKRELLSDEKERAEHLMLLDLARNDLHTGCRHDSVSVTQSFEPEVYSHLIHIVSEVIGEIHDDVSPLRLFCNTFPAGTVSGAPKVRAIELIDQYEISPRGFYAGCAGYLSYSQDIDTCIIIRSSLVKKDRVILRAGAGIVYDSGPEKEFRETENKLGALFDALKNISILEKANVFND